MSEKAIKVLLVDDDEDEYTLVGDLLAEIDRVNYDLDWVATYDAAFEAIARNEHDVYLIDYRLGKGNGLDLLREALANGCKKPLIILTGQGDEEIDAEAMRAGAADYLEKNQIARVHSVVHRDQSGRGGTAVGIHAEASLLERSIRHAIERAQTLEALRESEERYRTIVDHTRDLVWRIDIDGYITFMSPSVRHMYGYDSSDLMGESFEIILADESVQEARESLERRKRGELGREGVTLEQVHRRKDGTQFVAEIRTLPIFDRSGQPVEIVGVTRDITERRRVEEELEKSERLYRGAIEVGGAVPYYQSYISSAYQFVGPAIQSLIGYSPEEFTPRVWQSITEEIVLLGDLAGLPVDEAVQRARGQEGISWRADYRVRTRKGEERWIANAAVQVRDDEGKVVGSLGILQDITERKRAEEELAAEKERLAVTLSSIGDGVIAADMQKKIVLLNPIAENLTCQRFQEVEGRSIDQVFRVVNEQTKEAIESPVDKVLRSGRTETLADHAILVAEDASERPIAGGAAPIRNSDGTIIGIVLVFRDVSREREIGRMKTDFVSSVSHELRTPLTSIKGFIATILRDPDMSNETKREFLTIIDDEANRLTHLVEDLLEISRIEYGIIKISREPVNIGTVVEQVLSTLRPAIDEKKLILERDVPGKLPHLQADAKRMQSVVTNLIDNAVKFTPERGRLSVSIRHTDGELVLRISDTGIGIPEEDLPKIFERFYRVHRPGTQIQGTGLGLAIVNRIVTMHGGRIKVESKINHGTTFTIFLPLSDQFVPEAMA